MSGLIACRPAAASTVSVGPAAAVALDATATAPTPASKLTAAIIRARFGVRFTLLLCPGPLCPTRQHRQPGTRVLSADRVSRYGCAGKGSPGAGSASRFV